MGMKGCKSSSALCWHGLPLDELKKHTTEAAKSGQMCRVISIGVCVDGGGQLTQAFDTQGKTRVGFKKLMTFKETYML